MNLGKILTETGRLWWRHWIAILLLNILWFLLQIPIITGPPATATFYMIGRKLVDDEAWDYRDLWQVFRSNFWQGWVWALPSLVLIFVLSVNFLTFQSANQLVSITLRIFWIVLLFIWLIMNLFYWPFWLKAAEPSWRETLTNCWKLILLNPIPAVGLSIIVAILLFVGTLLALPVPFGLIGLMILSSLLFVDEAVHLKSNNPAINRPK